MAQHGSQLEQARVVGAGPAELLLERLQLAAVVDLLAGQRVAAELPQLQRVHHLRSAHEPQ